MLQALLFIYGIGILFTVVLAMFISAREMAEKLSLKTVLSFPLYLAIGFLCGLFWPIMLLRDSSFREAVVEVGRIAIIFGYLISAFSTFAYPWVWAWYISFFVAWLLLERYHRKSIDKEPLLQPRE